METKTEDMLSSYVMSVLTGTLTGRRMSADDVTDQIVDNGWADPTDEVRAQVEAKLQELLGQGWVDQAGDMFAFSQKTVSQMMFGADEDEN